MVEVLRQRRRAVESGYYMYDKGKEELERGGISIERGKEWWMY